MSSMRVLIFLIVLLCVGCEVEPRKRTYIITERGLLSYSVANCTLGMLTNNDHDNILDENSKPITCSGYIKLTAEEYQQWSAP